LGGGASDNTSSGELFTKDAIISNAYYYFDQMVHCATSDTIVLGYHFYSDNKYWFRRYTYKNKVFTMLPSLDQVWSSVARYILVSTDTRVYLNIASGYIYEYDNNDLENWINRYNDNNIFNSGNGCACMFNNNMYVVVNDYNYVNGNYEYNTNIYSYDFTTYTLLYSSSFIYNYAVHQCIYYNGDIYLRFGNHSGVKVFNILNHNNITDLATPMKYIGSICVYNQCIYFISGAQVEAQRLFYKYDGTQFTLICDLTNHMKCNYSSDSIIMEVINNKLYLLGDCIDKSDNQNSVYIYNSTDGDSFTKVSWLCSK